MAIARLSTIATWRIPPTIRTFSSLERGKIKIALFSPHLCTMQCANLLIIALVNIHLSVQPKVAIVMERRAFHFCPPTVGTVFFFLFFICADAVTVTAALNGWPCSGGIFWAFPSKEKMRSAFFANRKGEGERIRRKRNLELVFSSSFWSLLYWGGASTWTCQPQCWRCAALASYHPHSLFFFLEGTSTRMWRGTHMHI